MRGLCCAFTALLIAAQAVNLAPASPEARRGSGADNKDPKDPNDPRELLQTKWDAVVSVLQNKDIDQKAKEKKIGNLVFLNYLLGEGLKKIRQLTLI